MGLELSALQAAQHGAGRRSGADQARHAEFVFRRQRRIHESRIDQVHGYAPGREVKIQRSFRKSWGVKYEKDH